MEALKLQAYLDGELGASEAREVAALVAGDAQVRALYNELKMAKTALTGNELEIAVPESREFYFSKIAREIERQEKAEVQAGVALPWWRRLVIPLGIAAVGLVMIAPMLTKNADSQTAEAPAPEVAATSTFSFYDEGGNVTVVWVDGNQTANGN